MAQRWQTGTVVTLLASLLAASLLWRSLGEATLVVAFGLGILVLLGWVVRRGKTETDHREDQDGTVWSLIPSWQYGGRHVESGGLTRDEQERSIREVSERATEMEETERHRD